MSSTTSTLEIVAKFSDQASSGMSKTAGAAREADKALAGMTQRLEFQVRAADLAAKSLQATQAAYDKNTQKIKVLDAALQSVIAAEGKESTAAQALATQLSRLNEVNDKLAQSVGRKQLALDKSVASIAKTRDAAAGLGQSLTQQAVQTEKSGSAFTGLTLKLAAAAAGFFALGAIANKAVDWAKEGASIEGVRDSFEKLAITAGTTGDTLLAAMQKASKGTISNSDLMAKANAANILTQGRLTAELPRLLEIAGASAKAMGTDVNAAFDSIVLGLSRNSKMIIDNLGITVDLAKANQTYADSIGVAVGALTDEQKSIAFTNEVLKQGDVLVQTLGTETLTTAEKIAQADAKIQNFTDGLKILAGQGLAQAADALTQFQRIMAGDGGGNQAAQALALTAESYRQYTAAVQAGNGANQQVTTEMGALGAVTGLLGAGLGTLQGSITMLTEAQFNAAQALQEYGISAEQASGMVQSLGQNNAVLTDLTAGLAAATDLDAEAKASLIARMIDLAGEGPTTAAALAELAGEFINGTLTGEELSDALMTLEEQHGYNAEAASEDAMMLQLVAETQALTTEESLALLDATYALTDEQLANAAASQEAELATALLADRQAQMEQIVRNVELGLYSEAQAAAVLASQFNISNAEAAKFLNTQLQLNAALGRQRAIANFGNVLNSGGRAAEQEVTKIARAAAAPPKKGRAAGGGSAKPKKSEAVKQAEQDEKDLAKVRAQADKAVEAYQKKREALEKSHADKLKAINDDARAKELAAVTAFNEDKFQGEVSFKEAIVEVDQDLWDTANAAQDAYWAKSQEMAQAGHAQQAADYLEAGTAYAQLVAENAQEIRDLQAQIAAEEDEAERARLEQRLAREREINAQQEQLAKDRVTAVENGGDQIEQERKDQIDKENADYSDAQNELKAAMDETFADITQSYADLGAAARAQADAIVAAAQAATAAINAIPSVPSGSGASSSAPAAPVEGSYALGTGDRGAPRTGIYQLHAGEIVPTKYDSDRIRAMGGLDTVMNRAALMQASGTAALSRQSTSTSTSSTFAPSVAIDMRGASGNVQAAKADILRAVRQELKEWNGTIGRNAQNRGRS